VGSHLLPGVGRAQRRHSVNRRAERLGQPCMQAEPLVGWCSRPFLCTSNARNGLRQKMVDQPKSGGD
jgi:hypothetical protein